MTQATQQLKAPFPWFGGKSRVAHLVWERFGDVKNYVEPFFGSGAVLLGRPHEPKIETINDKDCYVSNFWRAIQQNPEEVARWADWPVNEADLHARHLWLVKQTEFKERMKTEPDYYDAKIAGWWVWGLCSWIGGGWCGVRESNYKRLPHLGDAGRGVHRKRPHLSTSGNGVHRDVAIGEWFNDLSNRLRDVRVCCGDWSRVCGESVTVTHGVTGVFLDPPYSAEAGRDEKLYATESLTVAHEVREWCVQNQNAQGLRIALCGYEGEHELPGWDCVPWKATGGYGTRDAKRGLENAKRERIWFSPGCLKADLFGGGL